MIYENPLAEILSVHKFKVNRATAEMLCYSFNKEVKCDRKINVQLFSRFAKYNPLYVFSYGGALNEEIKDQPIVLQGVEIVVPAGKEEEFMDDNSNFIFYGGSNSGIEWLDDLDEEDGYKNVYGTCRINF
jgi:hypothetical protein